MAWRDERGRVQVERVPAEVRPDSEWLPTLLEVLEYQALTTNQAARMMMIGEDRSHEIMRHLERRGIVVRATSGEWFRAEARR